MILTGHSDVDYARVVELAPRIFDTKNVTGLHGIKGNPKVRRL
jgi:hypothetical protein